MQAPFFQRGSFKAPKVVLVDDDLPVLGSLRFFLETEGFEVDSFESGMDLLKQPILPVKGCFIIDYHMPRMNGLELLARLRDRRSVLPAFLMTGHPDRAIERNAERAGVLQVFCKPHLGGALVQEIRKAIQDH